MSMRNRGGSGCQWYRDDDRRKKKSLIKSALAILDRVPDVDPDPGDELPKFNLDDYEMERVPGETDDEYRARLKLFR